MESDENKGDNKSGLLDIPEWRETIRQWKLSKPYEHRTEAFTVRNCLGVIRREVEKDPGRFILVTDVGQHQMWSSLSTLVGSSCQWLTSGGSGSMGFAIPAAMGAAFAHPSKTVLCITGDGGVQMNIQEIGTIAAHNLNVKVLIMNNNFLGMVRQWQQLFYANNYSAVNITSPNYEKLAEAYGIQGYTVRSEEEMGKIYKTLFGEGGRTDLQEKGRVQAGEEVHTDAGLKVHTLAGEKGRTHSGPVIVDFQVAKEDNVFPMVPGGKTLGETILE